MPRFYFHIMNNEHVLQDEKGIVLDGVDAAAAYAQRIVREIAESEQVTVLVTDAEGRTLMWVAAPDLGEGPSQAR